MLRISLTESPDGGTTLRLEGQLAGPWVGELREAAVQALKEGRRVVIDVADVSLIDRDGFELLAAFSAQAVTIARCSPFQDEQLRRLTAQQMNNPPL